MKFRARTLLAAFVFASSKIVEIAGARVDLSIP